MTSLIQRAFVSIAILALLAAIPGASAQEKYAYGSVVDKADYDFTPVPKAVTPISVCFRDLEGSGALRLVDPIYLAVAADCTGSVKAKDIRLTPFGSYKAGTEVSAMDDDMGRKYMGPLGDKVRFIDQNGDGVLDPTDAAYLDIIDPAGKKVEVGDVRLTTVGTYVAGTRVRNGELDQDSALSEIGAGVSLAAAHAVYKAGSTVYINTDLGAIGTADIIVEDKDIRLLEKTTNPTAVPADVRAIGLKILTLELRADETFQVQVTVQNAGKGYGVGLLASRFDQSFADARLTPVIRPGEIRDLVVPLVAPKGGGMFALRINDLFQVITVAGANGTVPTADETDLAGRLASLEARLALLEAPAPVQNVSVASDVGEVKSVKGQAPGLDGLLALSVLGLALVLRRRGA